MGEEPALELRAPPPHTAPRGGISAAQMANEREIERHDGGKGDAEQGKGSALAMVAGEGGLLRPAGGGGVEAGGLRRGPGNFGAPSPWFGDGTAWARLCSPPMAKTTPQNSASARAKSSAERDSLRLDDLVFVSLIPCLPPLSRPVPTRVLRWSQCTKPVGRPWADNVAGCLVSCGQKKLAVPVSWRQREGESYSVANHGCEKCRRGRRYGRFPHARVVRPPGLAYQ